MYTGNGPVTKVDPSGEDDWWRPRTLLYRKVQYLPSYIADLTNFISGASCWAAMSKAPKDGRVQLIGSAICSVLTARFFTTIRSPYKTDHRVYRMNDSGHLLDEWKFYEVGSSSGAEYLYKTVRVFYVNSARCRAYLTGQIGWIGLTRALPATYCSYAVG